MKPTNLTNLDFNEIRESIKSYMRTRKEFSDYDFTGSTLSYLLDVLAYNTYYSAFNANMALNELFLDSATTRDNVVNLSKLLNYTPRSHTAAKACVRIEVITNIGTNGSYPSYVVLKTGPVCGGTTVGAGFSFVIQEDKIAKVDQTTGVAVFEDITVYEGNILSYEYTVDKTNSQKYFIPNEKVDTSLLKVSVRQNEQSTQFDTYNIVKNITSIDPLSRVYFLTESNDRRYEVIFGDGVIGKELEDGQVIRLEYIVTNGEEANNIQEMSFIGEIVDSNGIEVEEVFLTVQAKSQNGSNQETVKSIKFNAPRYYAAQNRAVTSKDYENLTKIVYPNAKYVNAYGGETLVPPIYGKVFLSIRTQTGAKLNNLTKKEIIRNLRPYAMASVDIVIEDPNEIIVDLNMLIITNDFVTTFGDGTLTESTSERIKSKALNALQEYGDNEDLNNFDKTFSLTKLQTDVLKSDKNIQDVLTNVSLYKRVDYPVESGPKTFTFEFGVNIDCSCDTTPGNSIQSSVYYTADRPGVPQYFEDDGSGTLRSYTLINNRKTILDRNIGTYSCETGRIEFGPVDLSGQDELEDILSNPDLITDPGDETILYEPGTEIPGIMCSDSSGRCQPGVAIPTNANNTNYIFVPSGSITVGTLPSGPANFTPSTSAIGIIGTFTVTSPTTGLGTFVPTGGTTTTPTSGTGGTTTPPGGTGGTTTTPSITGGGSTITTTTPSITGGLGITGGGSTSTTTTPIYSGFIPSTISVGVAPLSLSISPGTFSPGSVMSFTTPTINVVPPGSPTTSTFPSGGLTGSPGPGGGTPALTGFLTFAPSRVRPSSGPGNCFI